MQEQLKINLDTLKIAEELLSERDYYQGELHKAQILIKGLRNENTNLKAENDSLRKKLNALNKD